MVRTRKSLEVFAGELFVYRSDFRYNTFDRSLEVVGTRRGAICVEIRTFKSDIGESWLERMEVDWRRG